MANGRKIESLKDVPLWFTVSADDQVVNPRNYVFHSYQKLIQAGAENVWLSVFENVDGTDSPGTRYMGHFSWICLLNNQVTKVQDREAIALSKDPETYGTVPSNEGGGSLFAGEFSSLFE